RKEKGFAMSTIKSITRRPDSPVRGEAAGREIEDELRFHVEMRARDNIEAGVSPGEAGADAMRRVGDFDHIPAGREEIKRERLAGIMKLAKGLTLIMLGCGLTLILAPTIGALHDVGKFLILIAVLLRLLIHLREAQPDLHRIMAAEPPLSVIHNI